MSNNPLNSMSNIIIPNTSEGRAIMTLINQNPNLNVVVEPQSGFKRKRPFQEQPMPSMPPKKPRYN